MTTKSYSRIEVIGCEGREYVFYGLVRVSEQDNGMTLKVFVHDELVDKVNL